MARLWIGTNGAGLNRWEPAARQAHVGVSNATTRRTGFRARSSTGFSRTIPAVSGSAPTAASPDSLPRPRRSRTTTPRTGSRAPSSTSARSSRQPMGRCSSGARTASIASTPTWCARTLMFPR
jgi:hypothetical protein